MMMSDLTRALRKAEDELTYALVDEMDSGVPDPRLAGFHNSAKQLIIMLRSLAGAMEKYEDNETIGQNVGHYVDESDGSYHD
jgi:hypothetical protein